MDQLIEKAIYLFQFLSIVICSCYVVGQVKKFRSGEIFSGSEEYEEPEKVQMSELDKEKEESR